jgi:hypothetical protein
MNFTSSKAQESPLANSQGFLSFKDFTAVEFGHTHPAVLATAAHILLQP